MLLIRMCIFFIIELLLHILICASQKYFLLYYYYYCRENFSSSTYRVLTSHPMRPLVYDFGQLNKDTEGDYIEEIFNDQYNFTLHYILVYR